MPENHIFTRVEQLEIAVDTLVGEVCGDDDKFWDTYALLPIAVKNLIISKTITLLNKNEELQKVITMGTDDELHDKLEYFLKDLIPPTYGENMLNMFNKYWGETDQNERKGLRKLLMRCYLLVNK